MVRLALTMTAAVLVLGACGRKEDKAAEAAKPAPAALAKASVGVGGVPQRKAGVWKQTVTMGEFVQKSRICLDQASEAKLSAFGGQAARDRCPQMNITPKAGGGWSFTSVCDVGAGGTTTTKGEITGDFNSKYRMEAQVSTEGAGAPQMNGARTMVMEAVWEGVCPAGFAPGEMELTTGQRINLLATGPGGGAK
ncbi:DUF3617 family protein [Phenylobacterium sp.]|uniref:DUF3617 domain-containing protein n=1 Tax=Phenylobacterium sp. TaxID=1871053 RepID=UPI002735F944|nr:DUF3617 family protein [Phenylobacterium sp.]MDP3855284.1 hypothetical protein [Phenylobacterium sp.]